jgi:hypothetical protein
MAAGEMAVMLLVAAVGALLASVLALVPALHNDVMVLEIP